MATVTRWTPQGEVSIGRISHVREGDHSSFRFDNAYLSMPPETRPLLGVFFLGRDGQPRQVTRSTSTRVHPWFANLLPEGPLRENVARQYGFHVERDYPLLLVLGADLPGAVVVRPDPEDHWVTSSDAPNEAHIATDANRLKFSLAGMQLKFSAVQRASGGLTIPAGGLGGQWIVKLPSAQFEGVPENEFDMMRLARESGFSVPDIGLTRIADIDGLPEGMRQAGHAYVVRRFDRTGSDGRVHMEDFAQVFGLYPGRKYETIGYASIAAAIAQVVGEEGVEEFIARLVFIAAIGNGDMHAKNWSLLYPDGQSPQLAPPYDMLSTLPYISGRETLALSVAGSKQFEDFSLDRLKLLAQRAHISERLVVTTATRISERIWTAWTHVRNELASPDFVRTHLDRHMEALPLFREVLGMPHVASRASRRETRADDKRVDPPSSETFHIS